MNEITDSLTPLEILFDAGQGQAIPLPAELATLYGRLTFPNIPGQTYTFGNFVTTLDGVVSLNIPGRAGGGEISGHNWHDRFVMGVLRAVSDAVVVGAGTLRSVPQHRWTPEHVFPPFADAFASLRKALGKSAEPLNVIVTAHGTLDLSLPVFQGNAPVLIVTTAQGSKNLPRSLPSAVHVEAAADVGRISARSVLDAVARALAGHADMVLVEGGPHLMGDFFAEELLNELFLTLSPQVAGRSAQDERPGLVEGKIFAPERPVWGQIVSVKRAASHLFLRYSFEPPSRPH